MVFELRLYSNEREDVNEEKKRAADEKYKQAGTIQA